MKKAEVCQLIREIGIVPSVKVSSAEDAHFAAESVANGGIPIVEITMTVPEAVNLISHLVRYHGKTVVGAGNVLTVDIAGKCIDAGASFLTSPGLNRNIVALATQKQTAVFPGALTPTEVLQAWEEGADSVKVFPCSQVGGDKYIKALKAALPDIPLIAAGGVTQHTAESYILAGATAIGVGAELIPVEAIENRESERIQELAQRFMGAVSAARQRLIPPKERARIKKTDFLKLDQQSAGH